MAVDVGGATMNHTQFKMAEEDEGKKLEFMAAIKLVPPAVLEEIHRRQMVCRAELGNWWERQHSKDFCLVPRDPQSSWTTPAPVTSNTGMRQPVEPVAINEVPTPDYAIEITSSQDYYTTNSSTSATSVSVNQFKLPTNEIQYFMTS